MQLKVLFLQSAVKTGYLWEAKWGEVSSLLKRVSFEVVENKIKIYLLRRNLKLDRLKGKKLIMFDPI